MIDLAKRIADGCKLNQSRARIANGSKKTEPDIAAPLHLLPAYESPRRP
jgi:hypothetical protein